MPERVYIGNLHRDTERSDLRDMFEPFGTILDLTVKTGFGFVEFESGADADDAVQDCNGNKIHGQR
jgi:arginine/serine-rich splicing factor 4/5/6